MLMGGATSTCRTSNSDHAHKSSLTRAYILAHTRFRARRSVVELAYVGTDLPSRSPSDSSADGIAPDKSVNGIDPDKSVDGINTENFNYTIA